MRGSNSGNEMQKILHRLFVGLKQPFEQAVGKFRRSLGLSREHGTAMTGTKMIGGMVSPAVLQRGPQPRVAYHAADAANQKEDRPLGVLKMHTDS